MSGERSYTGSYLTLKTDTTTTHNVSLEDVDGLGHSVFQPGGSFFQARPDMAECLDAVGVEVCVVCGDRASGRHYGAVSCEGCKGFFKRSIRKETTGYLCRGNKDCEVNRSHRNRCQYCRMEKCLAMGMRGDSVQSERRRGRPSLNGIKKRVNCRQSSYERMDQAQIIQTNCPPVNNNILIDDQDNVLDEGCGQTDDLINENGQVFNSLNELKSKLRKKPRVSYTTPFVNPCIFEDLPPSLVIFQLSSNLPPPHKPDSHYVCETASRILFLSVHWAKRISFFHSLPSSTQVSLLRTSWADLFILGLVQCRDQVSLPVVLTFIATHLHTCLTMDSLSLSRSRNLVNTLTRVRDIVNRITELALEPEEYAYLRLTYLFGPDQTSPSLQKLNDCVLSAFTAYYERNTVLGEGRLAKLILRTAPLRYCTQDRLEELFFSGLIGDVKIDGVIPYILDMEVEGGKVDEEDFVQENVLEKNNK